MNFTIDRLTRTRNWLVILWVTLVLAAATPARAQPADPWADKINPAAVDTDTDTDTDTDADADVDADADADADADGDETGSPPGQTDPANPDAANTSPASTADSYSAGEVDDGSVEETEAEPTPPTIIRLPRLFAAPSGRLLPAALLYTTAAVDTGGGLSAEVRAGLGDVAEFGLAATDLIRARQTADDDAKRIFPYILATFKMGVAEHRLFKHQPALALGFRKSFERETDGHKTRIAELYLVGTKSLGDKVSLHLGGVFWDASIQATDAEAPDLHNDRGWQKQLRGFGGIEIEPLPDAQILLETFWVPEFCYDCTTKRTVLKAMFSWGVRYAITDWFMLESGVRIPDIQDMNLIDAQIFGQVKFISRRMTKLMKKHRK